MERQKDFKRQNTIPMAGMVVLIVVIIGLAVDSIGAGTGGAQELYLTMTTNL